jgi:AcrR family transcriptional regulator
LVFSYAEPVPSFIAAGLFLDGMYSSAVIDTEESSDRRVRRSRTALRAAVLDLVTDHPYDKLTVADVLRRADVSRGTFYSHYTDKDALFTDAVEHLVADMVVDVVAVAAKQTATLTGAAVRALFRHAQQHRAVYLSMLDGAAAGGPLRHYVAQLTAAFSGLQRDSVAAVGSPPRMPLDAVARCWVGEQLALTAWWLEESPDLDVNELTRMRMHLMTGGATWAYGLEPGQLTFEDNLDAVSAGPKA